MATLSILSYNLSQGLSSMTSNENGNSGSNSNTISLPKAFNKITVQNVLSENKANALNISNNSSMINNANAIVKKIKDFGMIGAVNAVHSVSSNNNTSSNISSSSSNLSTSSKSAPPRKRRLDETKVNKTVTALVKPTATTKSPAFISAPKKVKICTKTSTPKSTIKKTCENANQQMISNSPAVASTPGRKGLPAPQAVARRNARERNRVKQVNNGFAALRERIPEEVAETFEAQGTIRGTAAKKLSKVETLRMAVEYIRSLERLLGFDFPISGNQAVNESFSLIKDEFGALSPGEDDQFDDSLSNYELDEDFVTSHTQCAPNNSSLQSLGFADQPGNQNGAVDLLPNITTLNGLQYIRIPGTNTYQLLTADLFAGNSQSPPTSNIGEEQFNALIDANCHSPRSASSATTTADLHSSPTTTTSSIMQATAPALRQAAATSGDHVKLVEVASSSSSSPSLSRSPVPETSPSAANSSLQRRCGPSTPTLSPASNEILLQACAADADVAIANNHHRLSANTARHFVEPTLPQQQQQQKKLLLSSQAIKQEFNETDFSFPATHSSNTCNAIIYQTIMQHQQLLLGQTSMAMSPPLDAANSSIIIPSDVSSALPDYFEHDHNGSFYEGNVTFKKEQFNEVALDVSNTTPTALSDESMMEAIDWWEAHTPNSDGGSVIM